MSPAPPPRELPSTSWTASTTAAEAHDAAVVLDADGLDALADPSPPSVFRAFLREALDRGRDVLVPAVVCAEACRDPALLTRLAASLDW